MEHFTKIEELLPFYVNGTLDDTELSLVEAALNDSPDLRDQVAFLQSLRDSIQTDDTQSIGGELGLARLMREIDVPPKAANLTKAPAFHFSKLAAGAIAAAIALAFGAGVSVGPQDPVYIQASGGETSGSIIVSFQPNVSLELVAETLLSHGVIIVDGPSASAYYRLALFEAGDIYSTAESLRALDTVFDFVDDPE